MFGLTPMEEHCLVQCYHEGHSVAQVACWMGTRPQAVKDAIRRASAKLTGQGLPRPKPHGRGCRRDLLAAVPALKGHV